MTNHRLRWIGWDQSICVKIHQNNVSVVLIRDRHLLGIVSLVSFASKRCETEAKLPWTFSNSSLKCLKDRYLGYSVLHFYNKKNAFHWTTYLMHRLADGFLCYKYVTDMSNLSYLFADLPYFLRKYMNRFYRVASMATCRKIIIVILLTWKIEKDIKKDVACSGLILGL